MDITSMLALGWYHIVLAIGLVGVIVFYILYRKGMNQ